MVTHLTLIQFVLDLYKFFFKAIPLVFSTQGIKLKK